MIFFSIALTLTVQTIGVINMGYGLDKPDTRASKHTDSLGFEEIGGVGQFIYHSLRFADYEIDNLEDDTWSATPFYDAKHPPDTEQEKNLSGGEILSSLCNLARKINDLPKEQCQ